MSYIWNYLFNFDKIIASKIQELCEDILQCESENGIKICKYDQEIIIFCLNSFPNYIFKIARNNRIYDYNSTLEKRLQKITIARAICKYYKLNLLVIPKTRKINIYHNDILHICLIQDKFNVNTSYSMQEESWYNAGNKINQSIKQLTKFICLFNYYDVDWRNIFLLSNNKFGIIDFGDIFFCEMNINRALFGDPFINIRGLIRCINPNQHHIVLNEAKKHITLPSNIDNILNKHSEEYKEYLDLINYYKDNNITHHTQINITLNESYFPEYSDSVIEKLILYGNQLIEILNKELIRETNLEQSIKYYRYILIDTNDNEHFDSRVLRSVNKECDDKNVYLTVIVKKLIELNCIYKLVKINGHGYYLQL